MFSGFLKKIGVESSVAKRDAKIKPRTASVGLTLFDENLSKKVNEDLKSIQPTEDFKVNNIAQLEAMLIKSDVSYYLLLGKALVNKLFTFVKNNDLKTDSRRLFARDLGYMLMRVSNRVDTYPEERKAFDAFINKQFQATFTTSVARENAYLALVTSDSGVDRLVSVDKNTKFLCDVTRSSEVTEKLTREVVSKTESILPFSLPKGWR